MLRMTITYNEGGAWVLFRRYPCGHAAAMEFLPDGRVAIARLNFLGVELDHEVIDTRDVDGRDYVDQLLNLVTDMATTSVEFASHLQREGNA